MTTNHPLSLFISSKMQELADERRAVQAALKTYRLYGWLWEKDAGARPEPIRSTYLQEVEACDIYLGLFWLGYGPYTIEEFEYARSHDKPCLIYEKHIQVEQQTHELTTFLERLQQVDNPTGLTVFRFQTSQQLAKQVQKDVMHLLTTRFRESRKQPASPGIWSVPYSRNPLFTGRETLLRHLHDNLINTKAAALTQRQAISGLGGIGKTQIALEYVYRYQNEYQSVFWIRATAETILTDFIALAHELNLPEKDEQDYALVQTAVKRWLLHQEKWLLILDNADDLDLITEYLPTRGNGHVLLTTREQAVGPLAITITVEKMDEREGMLLLLRRATILASQDPLTKASQADQNQARAIVNALDGLPLALDQAGAYIEETGCSLASYFEQYQHTQQRAALLQRRGRFSTDHPTSVDATFMLCFKQVEQRNIHARDLLRVFAFLDADSIPEELVLAEAKLSPPIQSLAADQSQFDKATETLRRFSLIRYNRDDRSFSLHRLVQAVLRAHLNTKTQKQWVMKTVQAVDYIFPESEPTTWSQCQRYLPQALACFTFIQQYALKSLEAAFLFEKAANYLADHASYEQAEPLFAYVLAMTEQKLGRNHFNTASTIHNLAWLYYTQGKYEQAELLFQQALHISEQELGLTHPDTASSFNALAELYQTQGKYEQAEPLLQQALAIHQKQLGADHPSTIIIQKNYTSFLKNK